MLTGLCIQQISTSCSMVHMPFTYRSIDKTISACFTYRQQAPRRQKRPQLLMRFASFPTFIAVVLPRVSETTFCQLYDHTDLPTEFLRYSTRRFPDVQWEGFGSKFIGNMLRWSLVLPPRFKHNISWSHFDKRHMRHMRWEPIWAKWRPGIPLPQFTFVYWVQKKK